MKVVAIIIGVILLLLFAASAAAWAQRQRHDRAVDALWADLAGSPAAGTEAPGTAGTDVYFERVMVDGLPAPAQRWLLRAIVPGAQLARSVELRMSGTLRLDDEAPFEMTAEQVLAPPRGFVWRAHVSRGKVRIRGYDRYAAGAGELRWWAYGLVPVVTDAGPDVTRSAAGRLAGEAALLPSMLLPQHGAVWEAIDDDVARATLAIDDEPVTFLIDVAPDGRLRRVTIRRWNGDPSNGDIGYMPFVVDFEGERQFGGYRLPLRMSAGWRRDGIVRPFFEAELDSAMFR